MSSSPPAEKCPVTERTYSVRTLRHRIDAPVKGSPQYRFSHTGAIGHRTVMFFAEAVLLLLGIALRSAEKVRTTTRMDCLSEISQICDQFYERKRANDTASKSHRVA